MDKKRLKIWYEDDQFKNQFSSKSQKEIIFNRWKIFKKIISDHEFENNHLNILDLGCGDGVNILGIISIFDELGYDYNITAYDYNQKRLDKIKSRFPDLTTNQYDIVNDKTSRKYDFILFNHVLEHIKEDQLALNNLSLMLKAKGLVVCGIPNEGCLIAQLRNNFFQRKSLRHTDHLHFYTSSSVEKKINNSFKIVSSSREGFFMPHDFFTRLFRKSYFGRVFLKILLNIFPSQSGGLIYGLILK